MAESTLVKGVMLALSDAGCTVWRQNTGVGWTGNRTRLPGGDALIHSARPLRAGLCVGSGDIIGVAPDGRFLSVEVKTSRGRPTREQITFRDAVLRAGGIAGIVWSVEEALELVGKQRSKKQEMVYE